MFNILIVSEYTLKNNKSTLYTAPIIPRIGDSIGLLAEEGKTIPIVTTVILWPPDYITGTMKGLKDNQVDAIIYCK